VTGDIFRPMTIECFVQFTSLANTQQVFFTHNSDTDGTGLVGDFTFVYDDSTKELVLSRWFSGAVTRAQCLSWTPTTGVWYHIQGTWLDTAGGYMSVDGSGQATSPTVGSNTGNDSGPRFLIGGGDTVVGSFVDGYIDEMRIVDGTPVYTADFTPPSAPFTCPNNSSSSSP